VSNRIFVALCAAYVGLIILANWLASLAPAHVMTVWPTDYIAPYAVGIIGLVLVMRDWIQQARGLWYAIPLMLVAGVTSYLIGLATGWSIQKIALASIAAFVVSESVEALVFTPLRKRWFVTSVALSATVGVALDSYAFLSLAFGSLAFFWGQFWGKLLYGVLLGVILTALRRRKLPVPARA